MQFYQFWIHIFWCSLARYISFNNCYVFLENKYLYHYIMSCFASDKFLIFMSFSEISVAILAFFGLLLTLSTFLHSFTFNLFLFLYESEFLRDNIWLDLVFYLFCQSMSFHWYIYTTIPFLLKMTIDTVRLISTMFDIVFYLLI